MKQLKAALFDLDGTLMDTEGQYTIFWGGVARKYRPDVPDLEFKIKGQTLVQIFATYFPDPLMQVEIQEALGRWEAGMHYEFLPGALDFLCDLRAHGVRLAIVTSSNRQKMQSVRRQVPQLDRMFDQIFTSEDFKRSKPDPDCYLTGAAAFGCERDECVVFEDAYNGLKAGQASGIFTVGITTSIPRDVIRDYCDLALDGFEGLTYQRIVELSKLSKQRW